VSKRHRCAKSRHQAGPDLADGTGLDSLCQKLRCYVSRAENHGGHGMNQHYINTASILAALQTKYLIESRNFLDFEPILVCSYTRDETAACMTIKDQGNVSEVA
jgi:hypothetical protein